MPNPESDKGGFPIKFDFRRRAEVGLLPHLLYKINIPEDSRSRIDDIKYLLHTHKKISFVVYFNHISIPDPYFAMQVIEKVDPWHSRKIVAPASYYHTEPDDIKNKSYNTVINEAKKCGAEIIRVIQTKDGIPLYGYSEEDAKKVNRKFLERLLELGNAGIPTGIMISPEGTRSSDSILGSSEGGVSGVGRALGRINPVIYIPVGIEYNGPFNRDKLNFRNSLNLSVGDTYIQSTVRDKPDETILMRNLAAILPLAMQGQWRET